ncbi:Uncharacterised protein [Chlamydia trachomatis]|nr:Uncharacterised protein [Chlamydia trachomatis]
MSSTQFPTLTLEEFKTAIQDISQFELESKKNQQKHFIFKLIDTNNELWQEINNIKQLQDLSSFENKENLILYQETLWENKHSLLEQIARIESINDELIRRNLISEQDKLQEKTKLMEEINKKDIENETQQKDGTEGKEEEEKANGEGEDEGEGEGKGEGEGVYL